MNSPLIVGASYLLNVLFGAYIFLIILRFILQLTRADFYNPVSQLVVKLTNFPLRYLRRVIPGYWGVDFSSIVLVIILDVIKILLLCAMALGQFPRLEGVFLWMLGDVATQVIELFFYAIVIQALMSWLSPFALSRSLVKEILYHLTEPLLRPARRFIPPISGFDLSPIPVMIVLQLLEIVLTHPLIELGKI